MNAQDIIDKIDEESNMKAKSMQYIEQPHMSVSFEAICQKCKTVEDLRRLTNSYQNLNMGGFL